MWTTDEWVVPIGYLMNGENTVLSPLPFMRIVVYVELLIGAPINCHAYWGMSMSFLPPNPPLSTKGRYFPKSFISTFVA